MAGKRPAVTQPIGRTGTAPIVRQGQTASGKFGDEPNAKSKTVTSNPRDLKP